MCSDAAINGMQQHHFDIATKCHCTDHSNNAIGHATHDNANPMKFYKHFCSSGMDNK